MSQSVLRNVRQQDRRESVDEFSPASRLRTAFREIPLLSANVCCDRLSANLNALRLLPSVFSISSLVLYTITCLIRIKIGYIVAQHSLKGQYRLYNVRGKGGYDEAGSRELKFAYHNGVWRFHCVFPIKRRGKDRPPANRTAKRSVSCSLNEARSIYFDGSVFLDILNKLLCVSIGNLDLEQRASLIQGRID